MGRVVTSPRLYMSCLMFGYAATLALMLVGYRMTVARVPGMQGVRRFTWALSLAVVGILLLSLRPFSPPWLTILVANELLFVSSLLVYCTAAEMLAIPMHLLPWGIATLAAAPLGLSYFTYADPSLTARIVICSTVCALCASGTAALLFLYRDEQATPHGIEHATRLPTAALAWSQTLIAFLHVLRCVLSILYPPGDYEHVDVIQVSFSYAYMVLSAGTGSGLIWLAVCIHRRELHVAAHIDPLTGVLNRRAFEELMSRELNRANRIGASVVLLLLDIDRFKSVNDTWGHQAGDEVLRQICRTLEEGLRPADVLSRLGGEEFVVLLRNADATQGQEIAERLRARVASLAGLPGPAQVTVSVGVAISRIGETPYDFFARCDRALYRSKNEGRNQVTLSEAASLSSASPQPAVAAEAI